MLPVAAIFGGNASGKTNFIEALDFAKLFVAGEIQPTETNPVNAFHLEKGHEGNPTFMKFNLLIGDVIYEFSFTIAREEVTEETLSMVTPTSERLLYRRVKNEIEFGYGANDDQENISHLIFGATQRNQLYLTTLKLFNSDQYRTIYEWFAHQLHVVKPDSRLVSTENTLERACSLHEWIDDRIRLLDTGIVRIDGEDVPVEQIPQSESSNFPNRVADDGTVQVVVSPTKQRYVISKTDGQLNVKKLVAYHRSSDRGEVKFDLAKESSGTQRAIDLLSAFRNLLSKNSQQLMVFDEIDRSLHSHLIAELIDEFLDCCTERSKSQLILTTHNVMLLDQAMFRRDELWVTERDHTQNTNLFSLSEYKGIRFDKDIRKSYLEGRLGGVPRLASRGTIGSDNI